MRFLLLRPCPPKPPQRQERSFRSFEELDADDPNKSFKGMWPPTDLWRKCVRVGTKISPALTEEIINDLPDPDIAAVQKVAFASSLLGITGGMDVVSDCRKRESSINTTFSN